MTEEFQISDIYNLEMLLKAKIHELQWKTDALDKMKTDFNKNRQMLYDEQMLLEKERRQVRELELNLKTCHEFIEFMEKDKVKIQQEKIQLQGTCDTATEERDSLLNQARNAKVENIKLMSKIQQLEEELSKKEALEKSAKSIDEQLRDEITKLTQNVQRDVSKLEKEQGYFRQSLKNLTEFNQRLVVIANCAQAEIRKQTETIKELQIRLNEAFTKEMEKLDEMELKIDVPKMQAILDETNESDSDEELDRQVEAFIEELRNADGE